MDVYPRQWVIPNEGTRRSNQSKAIMRFMNTSVSLLVTPTQWRHFYIDYHFPWSDIAIVLQAYRIWDKSVIQNLHYWYM